MDQYTYPNVPVVPRILVPSQYSSKKFSMTDDGYGNHDSRSPVAYLSPTQIPNNPLSLRQQQQQQQLNNNNENIYSNQQPSYPNNIDKGRMKKGIYHEPLKDNSGDNNSFGGYQYPISNLNNLKRNSFQENPFKCSKTLIIIFVIIIGLFSLTALAISIYLLVRSSTTSL
ncbi:unnamed protein product [Adineta steineri]|uniref:Uncharacterized protein n=1 Tax=Adineta steineri TaxID=433720 RepID=A0A814MM32_9BILA|nr:unnamed protein product [Adineta steineri]CAF3992789.1 unnamed protein product [Adineta steineri]